MDNDPQNPRSQSPAPYSPSRVLGLKEVCKVTGLGRSFIYELQAQQRFSSQYQDWRSGCGMARQ
jgi:hypothetical protein